MAAALTAPLMAVAWVAVPGTALTAAAVAMARPTGVTEAVLGAALAAAMAARMGDMATHSEEACMGGPMAVPMEGMDQGWGDWLGVECMGQAACMGVRMAAALMVAA